MGSANERRRDNVTSSLIAESIRRMIPISHAASFTKVSCDASASQVSHTALFDARLPGMWIDECR